MMLLVKNILWVIVAFIGCGVSSLSILGAARFYADLTPIGNFQEGDPVGRWMIGFFVCLALIFVGLGLTGWAFTHCQ
jgi:hypothetical protein